MDTLCEAPELFQNMSSEKKKIQHKSTCLIGYLLYHDLEQKKRISIVTATECVRMIPDIRELRELRGVGGVGVFSHTHHGTPPGHGCSSRPPGLVGTTGHTAFVSLAYQTTKS